MGQLAEIVFERVEPELLASLVTVFLGRERLAEAHEVKLFQLLATQGNADLVLSPICMVQGAVCINSGAIRVLRYGQVYDVEFTWDLDEDRETFTADGITVLHQAAIAAATRHSVDYYYGGLEPARDEETRFFTKATRGPLIVKG